MLRSTCDRRIDYLRISVTDRCNLRCVYCMPAEGVQLKSHHDLLSYEDIFAFAKVAVEAGISRIRITGGEPLVRAGLPTLIGYLSSIEKLSDLSMTTNGILLPKFATELRNAGLKRINLSIDSLDKATYSGITRGGDLSLALKAIDVSIATGFDPVKLNVVMMENVLAEIDMFLDLVRRKPVHVRFIELMPGELEPRCCAGETVMGANKDSREQASSSPDPGIGAGSGINASPDTGAGSSPSSTGERGAFVSRDRLFAAISKRVALEPAGKIEGAGPANYYRFASALGTIGFISPVSRHFCDSCNRLRLSSNGRLIPCLFSSSEIDARCAIKSRDEKQILSLIRDAIEKKPVPSEVGARLARLMSRVGG
jgi:GTP 3',8-cyclase